MAEKMAAMSEKERLYTPSEWNKRYGSDEIRDKFYTFCTQVTERARKDFKCELNVPYGSTERAKYDVYGVDLPKDAPIFVFIHGGYWHEFSKDLTGFSIPLFVRNNIKVINVGYDLCPNDCRHNCQIIRAVLLASVKEFKDMELEERKVILFLLKYLCYHRVKLAEIVAQIKSAVAQILKYAADSGSKSVCIAGHSAGAHLTASLLHDDDWIDRMTRQGHLALIKHLVLIGGIYNVAPLTDIPLGDILKLTEKEIKTLSLSKLDEVGNREIRGLKVTVTVGDCDSPLFVNESREYAQKIISTIDNVEYLLLRDIDHFNIVENLLDPNYHLAKLILHNLQPDASIR